MKPRSIQGKWLVAILHIAAWIVVTFIPIYIFSLDNNPDFYFILRILIRTLFFAAIFYLNYFILVPRLLFKQLRVRYYLSAAALIAGLFLINFVANKELNNLPGFQHQKEEFDKFRKDIKFMPKHPWRFDIFNFIFTSVLISGFSLGLRMAGKYSDNEKRRKELEKEMLNSELAFLKNQISPHFFFNTLNNIYSLTEINTADAQKAILQLSKMMRYLLYESEQGDTLLSKELDFMRNYIELMKLRLSDKVRLTIRFPEEYEDIEIPPLLFIPFIENAFKHGISNREESFIDIGIASKNNEIQFTCINRIFAKKDETPNGNSGIGLENIKKRLNLLFPDKHSIGIVQHDEVFSVSLRIVFE